MKLRAEILPIDRMYYGTRIELTAEDGSQAEFHVWINAISGDYAPSSREYDFIGRDGKFYVRYDHEFGTDEDLADEYEIRNNHYETAAALKVCEAIVAAINGLEV